VFSVFSVAMDAAGDRRCFCGEKSGLKLFCPRCDGLLRRTRKGSKPNMAARRNALDAQWRASTGEDPGAFVCAYTGIALTHKGGATNAEWEHVIPGDESSVVLVAALVNRMKADLTEEEWDAMIAALYDLRIEGKPFDETALPDRWGTKASSWIEDE
jgi:hypothetical protein